MFDFLKKKKIVPFDELVQSVQPAIDSRDEVGLVRVLDEIIERMDENPVQAEGTLGWAILVGCEFQLNCIGKYVGWFVNQFPNSISPVSVELAVFMAGTEEFDPATDMARQYLRVLHDAGVLARLQQMPMAQRGASKAFLPFTSAYTHIGARSYSKRILAFARRLPLIPDFIQHIDEELGRLDEELREPANAAIDAKWANFFSTGKGAGELAPHCQRLGCPLMAKRVELIESNFRFKAGYRVDEREFLETVRSFEANGKETFVLS